MIKRISLLLSLSIVLAVPMFASSSTVKINNKSKWNIFHLYIAPHDTDDWGPDQLGEEAIATGGSFTVTDIPCEVYDVKVVDEDGDECIIEAAKLCADNAYWNITDQQLIACASEDE
jgi:hypothetical protein